MSQMHLLHELADLERSRLTAASGDDQRQFARHVIRGEAELFPAGNPTSDRASVEAQLRDVSRGGLGFVCREALPLGSKWRVEFRKNGHAVADQTIVVRHCSEVRSNLYLCGAQFIASAGLLTLLGVSQTQLLGESEEDRPQAFLPPGEVA